MKTIHDVENPTVVKSEDRNQGVADKKDLKAIKEELPAQDYITIECHYCKVEFTDKISLINHMKIVHDAEKPAVVKSENRSKEVTDKKDLKSITISHDPPIKDSPEKHQVHKAKLKNTSKPVVKRPNDKNIEKQPQA